MVRFVSFRFVWFRFSIMSWSFETDESESETHRRKERPLLYVRAFFVSHFQRRSLPQIPSGFPSPFQPKNNPICQVPIPRNPEELVTIALTSILATGGSIPEGNRMESWFQKGDPSILFGQAYLIIFRTNEMSIPAGNRQPYPWLLIIHFIHEHARPILFHGWWVVDPPPRIKYIVMIDVVRGGIIIDSSYIRTMLFLSTTCTLLPTLWIPLATRKQVHSCTNWITTHYHFYLTTMISPSFLLLSSLVLSALPVNCAANACHLLQ